MRKTLWKIVELADRRYVIVCGHQRYHHYSNHNNINRWCDSISMENACDSSWLTKIKELSHCCATTYSSMYVCWITVGRICWCHFRSRWLGNNIIMMDECSVMNVWLTGCFPSIGSMDWCVGSGYINNCCTPCGLVTSHHRTNVALNWWNMFWSQRK